jgi:hypothetical protein
MIAVTRTSQLTGQVHTLDLDVTEEQMQAYAAGALIQEAFPGLSDDDREFIMTGITAAEWEAVFGPDDEEGE